MDGMSTKTYMALCRRSQGWWAIAVPEVPGALSQARRLGDVERMVRDVVALALEVAPDSFDVRLEVALPERSQCALERAAELRRGAQVAVAGASRATVEAARLMVAEDGLTMREAGQLLGLSHQRIAQLVGVAGARATGRERPPESPLDSGGPGPLPFAFVRPSNRGRG
jgi:predicted RNase H-like HicB family nuclease